MKNCETCGIPCVSRWSCKRCGKLICEKCRVEVHGYKPGRHYKPQPLDAA